MRRLGPPLARLPARCAGRMWSRSARTCGAASTRLMVPARARDLSRVHRAGGVLRRGTRPGQAACVVCCLRPGLADALRPSELMPSLPGKRLVSWLGGPFQPARGGSSYRRYKCVSSTFGVPLGSAGNRGRVFAEGAAGGHGSRRDGVTKVGPGVVVVRRRGVRGRLRPRRHGVHAACSSRASARRPTASRVGRRGRRSGQRGPGAPGHAADRGDAPRPPRRRGRASLIARSTVVVEGPPQPSRRNWLAVRVVRTVVRRAGAGGGPERAVADGRLDDPPSEDGQRCLGTSVASALKSPAWPVIATAHAARATALDRCSWGYGKRATWPFCL